MPPNDSTTRQLNIVTQLVARYGVLTREMVSSEGLPGGFSAVYPVLKAMEEAGKLRRGYFVAGLGATQFASPGAEDRLRQTSTAAPRSVAWTLAATDPANPYGATLAWPDQSANELGRPQRAAGARVILVEGHLVAYLAKNGQHLRTFLPATEPQGKQYREALAQALVEQAQREPLLIAKIDGVAAGASPLASLLQQVGFISLSSGLLHRGIVPETSHP